jgi:hypothetical protein
MNHHFGGTVAPCAGGRQDGQFSIDVDDTDADAAVTDTATATATAAATDQPKAISQRTTTRQHPSLFARCGSFDAKHDGKCSLDVLLTHGDEVTVRV